MDEFSVSYDRTTKIVTALACVLLAMPAAALHNIAFRIAAIPTLVVEYAYSSKACTFSEEAIVVKRFIREVRVPLEHLREVRPTSADDFRGE